MAQYNSSRRYDPRAVRAEDKFSAQTWTEGQTCDKCHRTPVAVNQAGTCKKCWMGK
jgi:hypothetical protein